MQPQLTYRPRDPADFAGWAFPTLDVNYDEPSRSYWMSYKAEGPPFYSLQTLQDMADLRESLRALKASAENSLYPVDYFVMASNKPGIFNLGGDLAMFAQSIRDQDHETLRAYAHACIHLVHGLATAFGLPLVTLSVITGQALGGGLEAALAEDFMLADAEAKLGVPEVAFNTFPGMGAVTLLSRRLGMANAEEMIASGKVYGAQEMFDRGVVDILAPAGEARAVALDWMTVEADQRFNRRLALAGVRRRMVPIAYDELKQITDLWVDCSCDVTPHDLRHMERLAAAQKKLFA